MVKYMVVVMCLWLALVIVGGIRDGTIMASGDQESVNELSQVQILSNPFEGTGINPVRWIAAAIGWLVQILKVITLDSSLFDGMWGTFIRMVILAALTVPILTELVARRLSSR